MVVDPPMASRRDVPSAPVAVAKGMFSFPWHLDPLAHYDHKRDTDGRAASRCSIRLGDREGHEDREERTAG